MTPDEIAAIRERAAFWTSDAERTRTTIKEDVPALLAEVERLTGEEQRLHGRLRDSERTISELFARNSNVQARLDKVRALADWLETLAGGDKHYARLIRQAIAGSDQ